MFICMCDIPFLFWVGVMGEGYLLGVDDNFCDFVANHIGFFQVGRYNYDLAVGYFIYFPYLPGSPPPIS